MFISASSDLVMVLIIISVFTRSRWPFAPFSSLSSSVLFPLFSVIVRVEESAVMLRLLFWVTFKSFDYEIMKLKKLMDFSI